MLINIYPEHFTKHIKLVIYSKYLEVVTAA